MKKINFLNFAAALFVIFAIFSASTNAYNSTLSFYESDSRLYYNSNNFDKNAFILGENISLGEKVTQVLNIENQTSNTYDLFLKAVSKENSTEANELLNHLFLTIEQGGNKVYSGTVSQSTDFSKENSLNGVFLGTYSPADKKALEASAELLESYVPGEQSVEAQVDWNFYASFNGKVQKIYPSFKNDFVGESFFVKTGDSGNVTLIFVVLIMVLMVAAVFLTRKKKNKL